MKGEGYLSLELFVYGLFHALANQWRVAPIRFVGFFAAARWLRNSLISDSCGLRAALQHKGATAKASARRLQDARTFSNASMLRNRALSQPSPRRLALALASLELVQFESGQYLERSQCE